MFSLIIFCLVISDCFDCRCVFYPKLHFCSGMNENHVTLRLNCPNHPNMFLFCRLTPDLTVTARLSGSGLTDCPDSDVRLRYLSWKPAKNKAVTGATGAAGAAGVDLQKGELPWIAASTSHLR